MLELSGPAVALVDEPLDVRVRGLGTDDAADVVWRARLRDDDGRVWKAAAERPEVLLATLAPAKPGTGPVPALRSLHPIALEVHALSPDGRGAKRVLQRQLLADGVRVRRWRERGLAATLFLPPAGGEPRRPLLLNGRAQEDGLTAVVAPLAAAVLASRGRVVLVVTGDTELPLALERLAAVPSASGPAGVVRVIDEAGVPLLPPGIPLLGESAPEHAARQARWAAVLASGAAPVGTAPGA